MLFGNIPRVVTTNHIPLTPTHPLCRKPAPLQYTFPATQQELENMMGTFEFNFLVVRVTCSNATCEDLP
jgi:hypothetical protein